MAERVMIFFDAPNFQNHLKRDYYGRFVDWKQLFDKLVGPRTLVEIHFHTTEQDPKVDIRKFQKQQRFLSGLAKSIPGLIPKAHAMQLINGVYKEKDVDHALCGIMGLAAGADRYDTAILVAADRDYVTTVDTVRSVGKRVELALFPYARADELKGVCDRVHYFTDEWLKDVWDIAKNARGVIDHDRGRVD
jgi:uncharacterized LabA/DUF88 family protein